MFNSGMKESIENKVEIVDFDYKTVEIALRLIYDAKCPTLTLKQKLDVLKFFDKYAILDLQVSPPAVKYPSNNNVLKKSLETSVAEDISFGTVVQIANHSLVTDSPRLGKRCRDFLIACHRMNRTVEYLKYLDKEFAEQVLKNSLSNEERF